MEEYIENYSFRSELFPMTVSVYCFKMSLRDLPFGPPAYSNLYTSS